MSLTRFIGSSPVRDPRRVCPELRSRYVMALAIGIAFLCPTRVSADGLSITATGTYFCPGVADNRVQVGFQNDAVRQGIHLGLSFNPEQLYLVSASPHGRIQPPLTFSYYEPAPGRLVMVVFDPTGERQGIPTAGDDDQIIELSFGAYADAPSEQNTSIDVYGAVVADSLLQPVTPLNIQNLSILVTAGVSEFLTAGSVARQPDGAAVVEWQFTSAYGSARSYLSRSGAAGEEPVRIMETPVVGLGPHRYVDGSPPVLAGGEFLYHLVLCGDGADREIAQFQLDGQGPPLRFAFHPPAPNPSDGTVSIRFDLPDKQQVTLRAFDVAGRQIAVPIQGPMEPGRYSVQWPDPRDNKTTVSNGVYFLRLEAGPHRANRRIVVVK